MDLARIRELMALLEDSSLAELEVETEDLRVRLAKFSGAGQPMAAMMAPQAAPAPAAPPATAGGADAPGTDEAAPAHDPDLTPIESPMVGTFYVAAAPGEPPFVQPGDHVAAGQTVCIVEAMKIMNEVAAQSAGVIEQVLVENGDSVEYAQPLFLLRAQG